jgi:hypothetical protein
LLHYAGLLPAFTGKKTSTYGALALILLLVLLQARQDGMPGGSIFSTRASAILLQEKNRPHAAALFLGGA